MAGDRRDRRVGGVRRFAIPLTVAATLAIAVTLFHFKQQVGDLETELAQVNRAIETHREVIQVMQSEWSYLNRPARIAELAEKHLGMRRGGPARLIRLEDLPPRAALAGEERLGAAPPDPTARRAAVQIPSESTAMARRAASADGDQGELQ